MTQAELKQLLDYDPSTGLFTWKPRPGNKAFNNRSAGKLTGQKPTKKGYLLIYVKGKHYAAHRLAFLYMTGSMPVEVDHENHVKTDNRWCNLLPATSSSNKKNSPKPKNNTSGVVGVYFKNPKWKAQIQHQGKVKNLGTFTNKQDAIAARKAAEKQLGFHPNHGH